MIQESKLIEGMLKAKEMGDIEKATLLGQTIKAQRTAWSQQNNFTDNRIVNRLGLDEAERQRREEFGGDYKASDDMGTAARTLAAIGRGGTDIGQAINQIGLRAGDAVGLVEPEQVKAYDEQIQKEAQLFDNDLGQTTSGKVGRFIGQTAATAPAGMLAGRALAGATGVNNAANAGRLATAGRYSAQGAGIGAVEGALQPVLNGGDNFLADKAVQAGMGAAFGTLVGGGVGAVKGGKELMTDGVANTVVANLSKGSKSPLGASMLGDAAESKATREAAERMGVRLSPAEKSGGKLAQGLESLTEQNLFTADDVMNKSTIPGLDSLKKSVTNYADGLSKQNLSVEQMGGKLQNLTTDITNKLVTKRSQVGSKLYGQIDEIAKGKEIIKVDNLNKVMNEILESTKNVEGSDLQKIASQVAKIKSNLNPRQTPSTYNSNQSLIGARPVQTQAGGMTAKQAKNQLQSWTESKGGNLFKDIEAYGVDDHYKKRLRDALLSDMDNAADELGGNVGEQMRAANQFWRESSEEIETFGNSLLGRTAGKELSSDIIGMAQNKIPPEKVIDSFRTAKPSQVKAAVKYMDKFDPALGMQFRANYIKNAVDDAMMQAPTAGAESIFNPAQLLNSLGVKSGRKGIEGVDKLNAILGDVKGGKQFVQDLIRLSRTKADTFGRNFSGTATQNQANDLLKGLGAMWSGLMTSSQKVLGTAGNLLGVKAASKAVIGNADDFAPTTLNWNGGRVSDGLAVGTAAVMPQVAQQSGDGQ
jgi:hypothetical protein